LIVSKARPVLKRLIAGEDLCSTGKPCGAVRQIDLALKINPKAVYAYNNRGNALQELNQLHDALASYDRALAARR
jgi:tetratricopeptide (TPR) repeat protein